MCVKIIRQPHTNGPLMLVGANARVDLTPCGWQQINFYTALSKAGLN
ncbi:Uncharacterised protein [Klebsiella pneumoniae]|nr:Uncharacterised protein [Klebsiella pneumoniae]